MGKTGPRIQYRHGLYEGIIISNPKQEKAEEKESYLKSEKMERKKSYLKLEYSKKNGKFRFTNECL